jgi:hypothetical protein
MSQSARDRADEDFEITLRARRKSEYTKIDEDSAAAQRQAAETVASAKTTAARLVEEAHAEVRRLKTIREESHHYLRALHGRLGDSLAESKKTAEELDARAADPPEPRG